MMRLRTAVADALRRSLIRTGLDSALARGTLRASPLSLRGRLVPRHWLYPEPTVRTIERDGIRFELDLSDYMEWCAYFGLETEPRAALYGLARKGDVVLDVGTNVGETLLNLARAVGPPGRVFGFEVNPRTYRKCLRNIELNPFHNIRLEERGLGHEECELALRSPSPRNSGGDRIAPVGAADTNQAGTSRVRLIPMDRWVETEALARIDLIKIDVEGFEMNVLRGAEVVLRRFRPTLFIELGDANLIEQGSSARELVTWLEGRGYAVTHAETGAAIPTNADLADSHFDIVCTPV